MELYYKDLISEDASLADLVDNLTRVVQGADEVAEAAWSELQPAQRAELKTRLERLKAACQRVKARALASARAADKTMHRYPYSAIGFAFSSGLLVGTLAGRKR
jgi:ElaB/YqjD/DUF883 family membrane-anchored ribosome-binding protein